MDNKLRAIIETAKKAGQIMLDAKNPENQMAVSAGVAKENYLV